MFEIGELKKYIDSIEEEKSSLENALYNLALQNQKSKVEISELCEDQKKVNLAKDIIEKELAEEKSKNAKLRVAGQVSKYVNDKTREEDKNEMEYLKINNKNLKVAMKRLNKELSEVKIRLKKDKDEVIKEFKLEIKQWRKELGHERSFEHHYVL